MFNRRSIHVALLLWGCIFCVIAALCMYMSRNFDKEKRRWLLLFQISSSILLLADALAWAYRGGTEMEAAVLVRVSNFLVFILRLLNLLELKIEYRLVTILVML